LKIGLHDKEFEHIKNPTRYHDHALPQHITWDRYDPKSNDVIVFTERCYNEVVKYKGTGKTLIAWPLESPEIHKFAFDNLKSGIHECFDYVFTFSKELSEWLKNHSTAKPIWWTPAGGWIWKQDHKIYKKTKEVQIIASKKKYAPGHKLRHEVIQKFNVDAYGRAYKKFNYTLDVFKDYRFAIVIENCDHPEYFTDKLTSAFYTGTVPIFWNSGWITKYFDDRGMLLWKTIDDLRMILSQCGANLYAKMYPYIIVNKKLAEKYYIPEDYMYNSFFKKIENEHR
jgi:hypothetical protein